MLTYLQNFNAHSAVVMVVVTHFLIKITSHLKLFSFSSDLSTILLFQIVAIVGINISQGVVL